MMLPLALLAAAVAQEPAAEPAPAPEEEAAAATGEEMVVFGDLQEQQRRQELTQTLLDLGYKPGKRRENGRTVYRPEVAWHPTVIVDDDGYAVMKRTPIRVEPWIDLKSEPLEWVSCIPPFTIMCVRLGGWIVSNRKLNHKKEFVAEGMDPYIDAWREVLVANAMGRRLNEEIPDMLEGIWVHGELPLGDPLQTPEDRRLAILTFWASRACTPEGAAARQTAADFLEYVVQPSPYPVTAGEKAAAESASLCGDTLAWE